MITIESNTIKFYEDTIMYLQLPYITFSPALFVLTYITDSGISVPTNEDLTTKNFEILYNFSYDKINYSDFKVESEFVLPSDQQEKYISILFKKKIKDISTHKALTVFQTENVDATKCFLEISEIKYNSILIDWTDEINIKFESVYKLVNKYPKFNFYDNQTNTIRRWKDTLFATCEMGGFVVVYFRTNPVELEKSETFRNNVLRNVVSIKKLIIQTSDGEFPQDRVNVSEWDMALVDDFICHINIEKFEIAFGNDQVPHEKDYLYIPLINKLFRVNNSQPGIRGAFGQIGWWEVFLGKWEEDETVTYADGLKESLEAITPFDDSFDAMDELEIDDTMKSEIFNQMEAIKVDTLDDNEKNMKKTIQEKKNATQNFTNTLVDSNNYISLKETETLREYYNRRLQLITLNPDISAFPITMYDSSPVDKNVVAMQYTLLDFVSTNKLSLIVSENFSVEFNYVLLQKFGGSIINIMKDTISLFTINQNRQSQLEINDESNSTLIPILFDLTLLEFYSISLQYTKSINQIAIKIFQLINQEKTLVYQNIYILNDVINEFDITHLQLFGGKFYSNDLTLNINNKQILKDYTKPLLVMNNG